MPYNASSSIGQYADLAGKTFLVTGASSGIGRAIAIALSEQQANVVINGRSSQRLAETAMHMGATVTQLCADITVAAERQALIEQLPPLDGICHAAGIIHPFPLHYLDDRQFDRVFAINTRAPMRLTAALLRKKRLIRGASILFISSIASQRVHIGSTSYSISKASIEAFAKSLALEHGDKQIRANCLRPAIIDTPLLQTLKATASAQERSAHLARYPLGRLGQPQDIAAASLFFLSSASSWITGTCLTVDGGLTISL